MIRITGQDSSGREVVLEVSAEKAAELLEGCAPLSMLDATQYPGVSDHMRRAAAARGFPMPPAECRTFDGWLEHKLELFPEQWRTNEYWLHVIKERWENGAAEGKPGELMDEETFTRRLADAMRLPLQGPY